MFRLGDIQQTFWSAKNKTSARSERLQKKTNKRLHIQKQTNKQASLLSRTNAPGDKCIIVKHRIISSWLKFSKAQGQPNWIHHTYGWHRIKKNSQGNENKNILSFFQTLFFSAMTLNCFSPPPLLILTNAFFQSLRLSTRGLFSPFPQTGLKIWKIETSSLFTLEYASCKHFVTIFAVVTCYSLRLIVFHCSPINGKVKLVASTSRSLKCLYFNIFFCVTSDSY